MIKLAENYIIIKDSRIHNRGVYARVNISKGTRIIEYLGEKITKAESERRSDLYLDNHGRDKNNGAVYIFDLNKKLDLDGNVPNNIAKYINHSCKPNAEVDNIRGKIWVIAKRKISEGEEISYDYGYDFEDYEDHPCHCSFEDCVGYIVAREYWSRLRKSLSPRTLTNKPSKKPVRRK